MQHSVQQPNTKQPLIGTITVPGKKKLKIHSKVPRLEEQVEDQVTNDSQHVFLGAKNITL
jgi:hypothetical protein